MPPKKKKAPKKKARKKTLRKKTLKPARGKAKAPKKKPQLRPSRRLRLAELYSPRMAAQYLNLSTERIRQLVHEGQLTAVKVEDGGGGLYVYLLEDLKKFKTRRAERKRGETRERKRPQDMSASGAESPPEIVR